MITLKTCLGQEIYQSQATTVADAVTEAVAGGVSLRGVYLRSGDLNGVCATGADLQQALFYYGRAEYASFRGANLRSAQLECAHFQRADFTGADFTGAALQGANLHSANLSGARGLGSASEYLHKHFETDARGVIAYKRLSNVRDRRLTKTEYPPASHWRIRPGAVLTEVVNPSRTTDCGSGVNVATRAWCLRRYPRADLWRVLIPWSHAADIVVPYNTDGKIRAGHVQLLEIVQDGGGDP